MTQKSLNRSKYLKFPYVILEIPNWGAKWFSHEKIVNIMHAEKGFGRKTSKKA